MQESIAAKRFQRGQALNETPRKIYALIDRRSIHLSELNFLLPVFPRFPGRTTVNRCSHVKLDTVRPTMNLRVKPQLRRCIEDVIFEVKSLPNQPRCTLDFGWRRRQCD